MKIRHKIKRLAWRRFILGYPPRKNNDTSIGDALNWEWFIECAKEISGKFIIVSRDSDFGTNFAGSTYLNDALRAEFRDRVGQKSLTYTAKLSEALKALEVSVTAAEAKSEDEDILNKSNDTDSRRPASNIYESMSLEELIKLFGNVSNSDK